MPFVYSKAPFKHCKRVSTVFPFLTANKNQKYREEDPFSLLMSNLNSRQTRAKHQQSFNVFTVGVIVILKIDVNKDKLNFLAPSGISKNESHYMQYALCRL
jgi:hypothetical protein